MRVLLTVQDKGESQWLCAIFERAGYIVDDVGASTSEELLADIKYSGDTSYGLLIHDAESDLSLEVLGALPTHLSVAEKDAEEVILKKAAINLAAVYDEAANGIIRAGAFKIDLVNRTVDVDDKPLGCCEVQFNILRVLGLHQDRPLLIAGLVEHIYASNSLIKNPVNSLLGNISALNRKIIEVAGGKFTIKYVNRGLGYSLSGKAVSNSNDLVEFGPVILNPVWCLISCGKKSERLGSMESKILMLLADKRIKKRPFLLQQLGGISIKNLDVHIHSIRGKIEVISGHNYIKTIWGQGYQLVDTSVPVCGKAVSQPTAESSTPNLK